MSQSKTKYYTVWQGRQPGIYHTWQDCFEQVQGFANARYKSFGTQQEAEEALYNGFDQYIQFAAKTTPGMKKLPEKPNKAGSEKPITPSVSVDAACSGNPGKLEYQGVDTKTKERIFYQGPFAGGTNNLGEFLAIVHALAYLKKQNSPLPVYSDSATARLWVKQKRVKTTLARTPKTEPLFQLIDRALAWLQNNTYTTQILTWETENWGENPADFGRKG